MVIASYILGKRYFLVPYEVEKIAIYFFAVLIIFFLVYNQYFNLGINFILLLGFTIFVYILEKPKKKQMKVKVVNKSAHKLPNYSTIHSAGMDLRANISAKIVLKPLERILVKTGIFIELPQGYEAQVRPRSGLALKRGVTVLNSPGTIDSDYRGEIGVILVNLSSEDFQINNGERIAQMVIAKHQRAEWIEVKKLNLSQRDDRGFGSTGVK